jgi:AmmeMemoRadiSam system protein A
MLDKSAKAELMKYTTSGELMGDFTNSVSYLSVAFSGSWQKKEDMEKKQKQENKEIIMEKQESKQGYMGLSESEKKELLKLARKSLIYYLEKGKAPVASDLDVTMGPTMKKNGAAFVTLEKNSELRGCIGDIIAQGPLYESVIRNAINAGVNDWRFMPVTRAECDHIEFEISALTEPKPISSYKQIRIGIDGVILRKRGSSAVFLPQVAPEQGWGVEEMLTHLSLKAGLSADAWKEGAEFFVFQADVFGEKK